MGWSGIIFVSGIVVGGFVGGPVWSQSLRMIDLTIFMFARFHVNGSREEIWNLAHNPF
jgi:hypothetical protein